MNTMSTESRRRTISIAQRHRVPVLHWDKMELHHSLMFLLCASICPITFPKFVDAKGAIIIEKVPEEKEALSGRTTSILCSVVEGEAVIFSWLKDGHVINPSHRLSFLSDETGSKLTLRRTEVSDTGNYTCVARNEASTARMTVRLRVEGMRKWFEMSELI